MLGSGFVVLTLAFRQDGRRWTGECLELGTATHARTLKQTHDELAELVTLHLNALEDVGECERFFREHGIQLYTHDMEAREDGPRLPIGDEGFFQAHPFPIGKQLVGTGA